MLGKVKYVTDEKGKRVELIREVLDIEKEITKGLTKLLMEIQK